MRDEAVKYLASDNRLAVIASLAETFGFTVAECAVNGVPFIAARAGGTAEVIADGHVQAGLFFEPTSLDLRRKLDSYFKMSPDRRRELRLLAQEAVNPAVRNEQVTAVYDAILERYRQESAPGLRVSFHQPEPQYGGSIRSESRVDVDESRSRSEMDQGVERSSLAENDGGAPTTLAIRSPLVTVAVTHYNLGLYLPEALAAIAAQTYEHLDVIVVDDGSTCPISVRVFNELRQLYPRFRFISQKNLGPVRPVTAPLPRRRESSLFPSMPTTSPQP